MTDPHRKSVALSPECASRRRHSTGESLEPQGLKQLLSAPLLQDICTGRRPGLLLLDYDGTLAPFTVHREAAIPYSEVRKILAELPVKGPGRFVIVSGREAGEVARLLDIDPLPEIWGCHGAERLIGGDFWTITPDAGQKAVLARAAKPAEQWGITPSALEYKSCSLALHTRALSEAERCSLEAVVKAAWAPPAEKAGLEIHSFNGGLELRLAGINKGRAVHVLAEENPTAVLVYLGDDTTDEDAFKALDKSGLGVLVHPCGRATTASYHIRPPDELCAFLEVWPRHTRRNF